MPAGSDLMSVENGPRPPVPCWPGRPVEMVAPYRVSENIPKKSLKKLLALASHSGGTAATLGRVAGSQGW